ncbi:hypothetical protein CDAR_294661 [Caerostris darwini]|uniref:Uncharacterized protein n=1 Tax=Caerostris darwini TaxID=1538125 RepID=A0AAV4UKJ6_9ARAC|nr:hypothetical protein CDAR_294661 [Caerostris darwini]
MPIRMIEFNWRNYGAFKFSIVGRSLILSGVLKWKHSLKSECLSLGGEYLMQNNSKIRIICSKLMLSCKWYRQRICCFMDCLAQAQGCLVNGVKSMVLLDLCQNCLGKDVESVDILI